MTSGWEKVVVAVFPLLLLPLPMDATVALLSTVAVALLSAATVAMLNLLERPAAPITPTGKWLVLPPPAGTFTAEAAAGDEAPLLSAACSSVVLGRIFRGGVLVRSLPVLDRRRPPGPFRPAGVTTATLKEFRRDGGS
jgi:hypothetical protein